MNEQFADRFEKYVAGVVQKVQTDYATNYPNLTPPSVEVSEGGRYMKVYKAEYGKDGKVISRSVHSFIDRTSGDVLKPETWSRPAKWARGNIYDADNGLSRVSSYGPAYLR